MKLLITGAKGQVGSELVNLAKKRNHEVYAYGSGELDITQLEPLLQKVKQIQPEVIS